MICNIILQLFADIAMWVRILVGVIFKAFHFDKQKSYDDAIFAGVYAKQACWSLLSGE